MSTVPQNITDFCDGLKISKYFDLFPFSFKVFYNRTSDENFFYKNISCESNNVGVFNTDTTNGYCNGYDKNGYNKEGYSKTGYNRDGFDTTGLNSSRVDKNGFDTNGYNLSKGTYISSRCGNNSYLSTQYRNGYTDGYKSGYLNGHKTGCDSEDVFKMMVFPSSYEFLLLLFELHRKLNKDEEFKTLKSKFCFIKLFYDTKQSKTDAFKQLYHMITEKYIDVDIIADIGLSVPKEFCKDPLRTKFSDILIETGKPLGFHIVPEQTVYYEYPIIFHFEIPYYANILDVSEVASKALRPFGSILYEYYDAPVENGFTSISKPSTQHFYYIVNATNGCVPDNDNTTYDNVSVIPTLKIDDMASYRKHVFHVTYKPLPFKPTISIIKKESESK